MVSTSNEDHDDTCSTTNNSVIITDEETTRDNEEKKSVSDDIVGHHHHARALSSAAITTVEEQPHCIHSSCKKLVITCMVSLAGVISPFSGTIYYPSLTPISEDFAVSTSLVNLSVTFYMIFQALSPSFWGPLSDLWGRRPIYLATLTIFIGVCAGLAVAPTFPALLVLRMFQAFGASSGIALGAGVIGDITTPAERGTFFSIFTSCAMSSTAIGPVIGGVIAQKLSWRWIFWILLVMGAVGLLTVLFFLPETLRSLVGNGSIYANPTPSQWLKRRMSKDPPPPPPVNSQRSRKIPNFLDAYLVLRHPDVILIMIINGCYMAILFTILTSTSTHFTVIYGLDTLQIGLCYIPYGVGSVCGSFMTGRMLDRDFRITARKHGMSPEEVKRSGKLSTDFPIYRARLRTTWIQMTLCQLVIIVYGWTLYVETHLAVPLILQFIAGLSVASVMNACQALVIDLFPGRGASITATSNIVRSLLGAVATATIEVGIQSVGLGWMFTIIGLILVTNTAFIPILIKYGPKWWRKRREQEERKATSKA